MNTLHNERLFRFISESPTAFHAVETARRLLTEAGYKELSEHEVWKLLPGGKYFATRNHSSIAAFRIPVSPYSHFQIIASHSDSPAFKIKDNGVLSVEEHYSKLNVEKYGGMIASSWFDRPLSIAGRVFVRTEQGVKEQLVNLDRDLAVIPNLAVHFNREINSGYSYNFQKDMPVLIGDCRRKEPLRELISEELSVSPDDLLDMDLFLYCRQPGVQMGSDQEFILCPRLDDLQCAFSSLVGFLASESSETAVQMSVIFDNEEVGSQTRQGALSTFLKDCITRIRDCSGKSVHEHLAALSRSFLLSADNGHAVHPNHPEKSDVSNRPYLNGGVLLKYNASQRYTTDALSASVVKELCARNKIPYQTFSNRPDIAGGSTLGNLSTSQVSIPTADIGLAQLAMHSACETGGAEDTESLCRLMTVFYNTDIRLLSDGGFTFA